MAMQITPEAKRKIQLLLLAVIALAAVRAGYVLYQRHGENIQQQKKQAAPPLNPDYYVTPRKLYPYDLKSAQQLTKQPVWVKVGYAFPYYPYDPTNHHANLAHEAGKLLPLQKVEVKDVVTGVSPKASGERQLLAVFEDGSKFYAAPIGTEKR